MAIQKRGHGLASTMLLILFLGAGCNRTPTAPAPAPGGPYLLRFVISGPDRVAPGTSAEYKARLEFNDGSVKDVTSEAKWSSTDPAVLFVTGPGSVEARAPGHATLTASSSGTVGKAVTVLGEGTFILNGWITEAGTRGYVAQARIETLSPPFVSTLSGLDGRYTLYGVAPDAELRVSKEGYSPHVEGVALTSNARLDVALHFQGRRPDFSGQFTLNITAAPECRSTLPQEALSRTYIASVVQHGPRLHIELDGARFFELLTHDTRMRYISGTIEGDRAVLTLSSYGVDLYPEFIEWMNDAVLFIPSGTVTLTKSQGTISGPLEGSVGTWRQSGPGFEPIATCTSAEHRFVLTR